MHELLLNRLEERASPINTAVIGCGFFGGGLVRELKRIKNLNPKIIVVKNDIERALQTYLDLGIDRDDIVIADQPTDLDQVRNPTKYLIATDIEILAGRAEIEVVFDATGSLSGGVQAALTAIENGCHFVTVNAELEATVGPVLAQMARERGIIYSVADGDQPGVLARMLNELIFQGFEPRIIGNCKEYFDLLQTPAGVAPYVPEGQNPKKICSFTDGSKQSLELTVVANSFGFYPLKRGMYGPETGKQNLVTAFRELVDFDTLKGGYIDFTLGPTDPDQGGPVFIIAYNNDPKVRAALKVLKRGPGPYYLFFRDYHMCHIEAGSTIAEAVLFKQAGLYSRGRYVDTIAVAKRDLKAGLRLDGIGGFDVYGLVERAAIAAEEKLLPLGLCEFATLKTDLHRHRAITYDMVDLDDNPVVRLRKEQERLPLPAGS
jgi:predicted homoserine dehydrogenase-like protein